MTQRWASPTPTPSLSARRAWIEIVKPLSIAKSRRSLSATRAWIEIVLGVQNKGILRVALRKESVDRNIDILAAQIENR